MMMMLNMSGRGLNKLSHCPTSPPRTPCCLAYFQIRYLCRIPSVYSFIHSYIRPPLIPLSYTGPPFPRSFYVSLPMPLSQIGALPHHVGPQLPSPFYTWAPTAYNPFIFIGVGPPFPFQSSHSIFMCWQSSHPRSYVGPIPQIPIKKNLNKFIINTMVYCFHF